MGQAFYKIYSEEGILSFWKREWGERHSSRAYAAAQLSSNDYYKTLMADEHGSLLACRERLSQAMAGMTGTALTHPLDTVRLRLALPNHGYKGMVHCFSTVYRMEGVAALYKDSGRRLPHRYCTPPSTLPPTTSRSVCITVSMVKKTESPTWSSGARRVRSAPRCAIRSIPFVSRDAMKGKTHNGMLDAMTTIARTEGMRGFFRGWAANTLKVVPQNSIRFVSFEILKDLLNVPEKKAR